ncbi:MAG: stage III sporulation protein AB [Firmicutes bacterium]|nr:stage III sporulation protein AB [Bacillota bacterium]
MVKVILIVAIFSLVVYIGWQLKQFYKKQEKILTDVVLFCECLLSNINFIQKPIGEIIEENKDKFAKEFREVLKSFVKSLEEDGEVEVKSRYITDENKRTIQNLFINLGKTDVLNQNSLIENSRETLKISETEAREESKTKGRAAFKLSLCLAGLLCILLI